MPRFNRMVVNGAISDRNIFRHSVFVQVKCLQATNTKKYLLLKPHRLPYHPLMYATIRKVIHDQWTCEDVLQESVRKFIDHIPQLREMDAASRTNYIVVACRYNAIEEEKRQRRAPFPVGNGVIDIASRDAEDPERQILLLDDADVLWRIWPQLDSRTRQLLEDKYILNMSDAEIASALGVKPSSVRMLLTRARSKARKAIEKKM